MSDLSDRQDARHPLSGPAAHANVAAANGQSPAHMEAANAALQRARRPGQTTRTRIIHLRAAADHFNAQLQPHSACRAGCSHCCHIALLISRAEAAMIGAVAGRRPVEAPLTPLSPGYTPPFRPGPCPFLAAGRCSIYHSRPIVCRTALNMDDEPLLCELDPEMSAEVPYADATPIWSTAAALTHTETYADIRDWFRPPSPAAPAIESGPGGSP